MRQCSTQRFAAELSKLLIRISDYSAGNAVKQLFGICMISPKTLSVPPPKEEIRLQLESLATQYFEQTEAVGYCFHYWIPPGFPVIAEINEVSRQITKEDYHISLSIPQFDDQWVQVRIARSLICCACDLEQHNWHDQFELQSEAIRLTPILHQTLKEEQIRHQIKSYLILPGKPIFNSFIYSYALHDSHFCTIPKQEENLWKEKKANWKERYGQADELIKQAVTLEDVYILASKKAASTRNPVLKSLFWAFVNYVESKLIINTDLPDKVKDQLLSQLRGIKKKKTKEAYIAQRPAVCISDIECGQMLYLLAKKFLDNTIRNKAIAEAIIFIWIAQHAAFSGHNLKEKEILSIKVPDINHQDLTILVKGKKICITLGLSEILVAYISDTERKNKRSEALFQNLSYDNLGDIINKYSEKFYGSEKRLFPKDFLEKLHTIPGIRISLRLRRQIANQEELVKASPYRIKSSELKNHIKKAIQKTSSKH